MKEIDSNNQIQNEALLNEYKGNLFEYLVGLSVSQQFNIENQFHLSINEEIKTRLSMYEEFIRINFPALISDLVKLATSAAKDFVKHLKDANIVLDKVFLLGKIVATNDNGLWSETDIVFSGFKKQKSVQLKVSLKLAKDNSFTSTKSAGVKSFIAKYFQNFPKALEKQNEFNAIVDFQFNKMGMALYQTIGHVFNGSFDSVWTNSYTSLPGELSEEHKKFVFFNYRELAYELYQILDFFIKENREVFINSLSALIGFSDKEIVQVITFHKDHKYLESKILSLDQLIGNNPELELYPIKKDSHFIEIKIGKCILQLRIKPMNKFTTPSYKVNCSIKEIQDGE